MIQLLDKFTVYFHILLIQETAWGFVGSDTSGKKISGPLQCYATDNVQGQGRFKLVRGSTQPDSDMCMVQVYGWPGVWY